ncbi:ATP-grasp domain-containing protein [Phytomonospora sp. NPDC050363]|uniref:ATP-grasp domain-containing protein n=1 Tax=Phytomonospora sp. NPDC050363 TaxID=3155642 RepID=UPI00340DAD6F
MLVQQPGSPLNKIVETGRYSHCYSVDFTEETFPSFVTGVLAPLRVGAVVSLTESGLLPAALANELLGTPGTPFEVVHTLRDKSRMRALLRQRAPELTVRYAVPPDAMAAAAVMKGWGPGVRAILKPRDGSGSRGVCLVEEPGSLEGLDVKGCILEEYVGGQEYSAESFSVDGEHHVVALVEKHVDASFVELAHVTPPSTLSSREREAVCEAIDDFLRAVGLRDGPAHTEFKIHNGSVKIIESHNRVGGDGIPALVTRVTGIDLKASALGWPLGLVTISDEAPAPAPAPASATATAAAAVAYATATPGLVTSVELPDERAVPPGVELNRVWTGVKPGQRVESLSSSDDRVGSVAVSAGDSTTALAAARELATRIEVTTTPGTA